MQRRISTVLTQNDSVTVELKNKKIGHSKIVNTHIDFLTALEPVYDLFKFYESHLQTIFNQSSFTKSSK